MAIKSGRNGEVKWDPTGVGGVTAVSVISLNNFTVSMATPRVDVTCFLDTNAVFVPGLPAIDGKVAGYYNSADLALIEATRLTVPGWLELIPDKTDPTAPAPLKWSGLAYLDAEVDTSVNDAPKLTGTFSAAGPWTIPTSP
jgi:hypothetical protein